jgi:predicted esterase
VHFERTVARASAFRSFFGGRKKTRTFSTLSSGPQGTRMSGIFRLLPTLTLLLLQACAQAQHSLADSPRPSPNLEVSTLEAGGDPDKRYFLMRRPHIDALERGSLGLVLIIPGGPGDDSTKGLAENLYQFGIPRGYLAARLLAKRWTSDQRIVWPTPRVPVEGMRFSTREFVEAVISDVSAKHPIDPERIFLAAWSSGGPAAYDSTLTLPAVRGAVIAASIFNARHFPPLAGGAGRSFYILHSADDKLIPLTMAETAVEQLGNAGARVTLAPYAGAHGSWMGATFTSIRDAVRWLEAGSP